MKQLTLAILLVFLGITAFTQHTVLLKHKQYETNFDTSLKYPKKVYWVVTKKSLTSLKDLMVVISLLSIKLFSFKLINSLNVSNSCFGIKF